MKVNKRACYHERGDELTAREGTLSSRLHIINIMKIVDTERVAF